MSLLLVSVVLMAILACNAPTGTVPTATPTPTPTTQPVSSPTPTAKASVEPATEAPQPTTPAEPTSQFTAPDVPASNVDYDGIKFYRDNELAASWACEVVPAQIPSSDIPEALLVPSHFHFTFDGYPLTGTLYDPQVYVFPARNFEDYNAEGLEVIARLQQFLKERAATVSGSIPFLPIFPAAQAMRTQVAYLNFQNGSGVRFLTQYGQAATPINNKELFYTFQGVTLDGQYYISVIMPVSHSSLPADGSKVPGDDPDAFANKYPAYIQEVEKQLGDASASSFAPSLEMLDTLVQSLSIKK